MINIFHSLYKVIKLTDYIYSYLWTNILKSMCGSCGRKLYVQGKIVVSNPQKLYIRDNVVVCRGVNFNLDTGKCEISDDVHLSKDVILFARNAEINIGSGSYLNHSVEIIAYGSDIVLGKNVRIGMSTILTTFNYHTSTKASFNKNLGESRKVIIEDDVWIGAKCVILPGVIIKKGAIVGAGAVVTHTVETNCIVGGVPAKVINVRR